MQAVPTKFPEGISSLQAKTADSPVLVVLVLVLVLALDPLVPVPALILVLVRVLQ